MCTVWSSQVDCDVPSLLEGERCQQSQTMMLTMSDRPLKDRHAIIEPLLFLETFCVLSYFKTVKFSEDIFIYFFIKFIFNTWKHKTVINYQNTLSDLIYNIILLQICILISSKTAQRKTHSKSIDSPGLSYPLPREHPPAANPAYLLKLQVAYLQHE